LGELVRLRAEQSPSLLVYTHLEDDEREVRSISAAALWRRARALAVGLTALPVGARVLLPFDAGLEFAPALIACTLAGVIGVPVPSPAGGGRGLERLLAICADAEVAAVLDLGPTWPGSPVTPSRLRDASAGRAGHDLRSWEWIARMRRGQSMAKQ
jgi:acyl-CoA synthetase (AMP-forming)/AMP-acid ligase II